MSPGKKRLSLLERHVHQELVAFDINDVAESSLAAASEVQSYTAASHAHVANAQMVQKFRQRRIHNVQFSPLSAGTNTKHRHQDEKY